MGLMTGAPKTDGAQDLFGNRFITQKVPGRTFPRSGMTAQNAMRLVAEELVLDGIPSRNLATFVTTWMEPRPLRT
jgi:glutamate decarboxylase